MVLALEAGESTLEPLLTGRHTASAREPHSLNPKSALARVACQTGGRRGGAAGVSGGGSHLETEKPGEANFSPFLS